jgi:hypothetical protein
MSLSFLRDRGSEAGEEKQCRIATLFLCGGSGATRGIVVVILVMLLLRGPARPGPPDDLKISSRKVTVLGSWSQSPVKFR